MIAIFIILMSYAISRIQVKQTIFLPIFLLFSFLIRLSIVLIIQTPLESDFQYLYEAASNFSNHINTMHAQPFLSYPYQSGIVLFHSFFLNFWNHLLILKIVNCVCACGILYFIYKIAALYAKTENARFAMILYSFFCFPLFYNTIIANQIPSALFFYWGIYIIMKQEPTYRSLISTAFLFIIANVLRPEGIVFVGSVIGYLILIVKQKNMVKIIQYITVFTLVYFIGFSLISNSFRYFHINSFGLVNNEPHWKYVLGFNKNTCGQWNAEDKQYDTNEKQKQIVKERLQNMRATDFYKLGICKTKISFGPGTLDWSLQYLDNEKTIGPFSILNIKNFFTYLNQNFYWLCFLLSIFGMWKVKHRLQILLPMNLLFLNFIAYLIVEVQPRYTYILQISIFLLFAAGFEQLTQWWKYYRTRKD